MHVVSPNCLLQIRVDEQIVLVEARADTIQLGFNLGTVLAMSHLQHRLDRLEYVFRESLAELVDRLASSIDLYGEEVTGRFEGVEFGDFIVLVGEDREESSDAIAVLPCEEEDEEEKCEGGKEDATESLVEHEVGAQRIGRVYEGRHDGRNMARGQKSINIIRRSKDSARRGN